MCSITAFFSTRFMYDGGNMSAEMANPSGAILRRYIWGPGTDASVLINALWY